MDLIPVIDTLENFYIINVLITFFDIPIVYQQVVLYYKSLVLKEK